MYINTSILLLLIYEFLKKWKDINHTIIKLGYREVIGRLSFAFNFSIILKFSCQTHITFINSKNTKDGHTCGEKCIPESGRGES